jgi:hypothetical protein
MSFYIYIYMQGIFLLAISFLTTFILSKTTNLKPVANYNNKFEYIPVLTSNILADLLIVYITFSGILSVKNSKSWNILTKWYKKYRLSAMIADILIGVLYLLLARYLVFAFKLNFNLFTFAIFAVAIQLTFDFLFYLLFSTIPKKQNDMLDMFKEWGKFAGLDALWGDSILVIVGVIVSAFLNQQSVDFNLVTLILSCYLVPYIIYKKN